MMLHPGFQTLSDFADNALTPERARRVAAHVAVCEKCRTAIWQIRALDAAALEIPVPVMESDLLERTLQRRAAGEEVILPSAETRPAERSNAMRHGALAAVAALLLVAVTTLWRGGNALEAEASALTFDSEQPRRGETIEVQYRAAAGLASHEVLVLRARLRTATAGERATHEVVTRLTRKGDRTYTGSFALPDSVVYAVFAVEDTAASQVDANAELWDLVLHDAAGKPVLDGLVQKYYDARVRNAVTARQTAQEMERYHPNEPRTWYPRYSEAVKDKPQATVDSIRNAARIALRTLVQHADSTNPTDVGDVAWYADGIGDTLTARVWRERLFRRFPQSRAAKQQRAMQAIGRPYKSIAEFWPVAEKLWRETGKENQSQLLFSAFQTAQSQKDPVQIERWGKRLIAQDSSNESIIPAFMSVPALQEQAMNRIRQILASPRSPQARPLTATRTATSARNDAWRAEMLILLGNALLERGKTAAALDTLGKAAELAWNPELFRSLAEQHLQTGDTAGAMPLLARVAVDPETPAVFMDSLRVRFPAQAWADLTGAAAMEMRRQMRAWSITQPLRGAFSLLRRDGTRVRFEPEHDTETVVAYWCRSCPPSLMQLEELDRMAKAVARQGARMIAITDEDARSPRLAQFMKRRNLSFEYYSDPDNEAARAIGADWYPNYLVIDTEGRIRYRNSSPESVPRQLWLLRNARQ